MNAYTADNKVVSVAIVDPSTNTYEFVVTVDGVLTRFLNEGDDLTDAEALKLAAEELAIDSMVLAAA